MANVRAATVDDIPAIIAMGQALHAESPRYSRLSFSVKKVDKLLREMTEGTLISDAPGGVFVAEKEGQVIGVLGGYVTQPFFSDDKIATDYTFYIQPGHRRKGRAAVQLIRAFEVWARDNGATDIIPGTTTMIDADATVRLYEKLGYVKYGYTLIKRLN